METRKSQPFIDPNTLKEYQSNYQLKSVLISRTSQYIVIFGRIFVETTADLTRCVERMKNGSNYAQVHFVNQNIVCHLSPASMYCPVPVVNVGFPHFKTDSSPYICPESNFKSAINEVFFFFLLGIQACAVTIFRAIDTAD